MEDAPNNNHSGYDHTWPGVDTIVKEYNSKREYNNNIDEC